MAQLFAGRCIGGPLDGQALEYKAPFYRHVPLKPLPRSFPTDCPLAMTPDDSTVYRHTVISWNQSGEPRRRVPLWVLADQAEAEVLDMLRQRFPGGSTWA